MKNWRIERIVDIIVEVIGVILGIHILLKLFNANPSVPFVRWMFDLSSSLLYPFQGIFKDIIFNGGYDLDLSAIFAMIIYGISGYLVKLLFGAFSKNMRRRK